MREYSFLTSASWRISIRGTSLKIASGKVFGIKHKGETIQEITIPDSEDKLIGKKIS